MNFKIKKLLAYVSLCLLALNAQASFIDTDTLCANYGCVVTSDNDTSNVYDVYNYAGSPTTIPPGGQLVFNTNNPVEGTGTVLPLYTNSNTNIDTMPASQGNRLRIINGLGVPVSLDTTDNGNGLLDAGDTLTQFGIQSSTKIDYFPQGAVSTLGANPQSHSFYITSRGVSFSIKAKANIVSSNGEFPINVNGATIGFVLNMTRTGTNAGVPFGVWATNAPGYVNIAGLDLQDLLTNPVVGYFTATDIRRPGHTNDSIQTKSVRMEAIYTVPPFSLSQGSGDMNWGVDFTFWRR